MSEEYFEISHYGTPRHSGRYPWGSGKDPYQSGMGFIAAIEEMEKKGYSQTEIAKAFEMSTTELRARKTVAKNAIRKEEEIQIIRLKEKQMSNMAIADKLGISEPTVRNRLKSYEQGKEDQLLATADAIRNKVDKDKFIDVGDGVGVQIGISEVRLNTAVTVLKDEGYQIMYLKAEQLGNPGKYTSVKVLAHPDATYKELIENQDKIGVFGSFSEDNGKTFTQIKPPVSVDSDRVVVRYGNQGGGEKDGVIELRRGVEDLSLGNSKYAQVRILVDGNHYMKGMAIYSDDLPKGVDMIYNTPKESTGNKLDVMKKISDDKENPFNSTIRQKYYIDSSGKKQMSPLNIVGSDDPEGKKYPGEEGAWSLWSKKLSSQMLSKQTPSLAKQQLDLTYKVKKEEFDEINSLTNPTIKKELLMKFADGADSTATHLKAASLPRTANHVILPVNSLKDNEVYAPNYKNGEKVVLIRHPHGGRFEIPQLTVNNRNKEAKSFMDNAVDAVGINARVAQTLSGADFDGDTVLVIPNNSGRVKISPPLKGLQGFDPMVYKNTSLPAMKNSTKQHEMGVVSNLITDMTLKGATDSELARAVRHSMVVIDAEKHSLDYKLSEKNNAILDLKRKYQVKEDGTSGGASTIISRASSEARIPDRRPARVSEGGPINPKTGEKQYVNTGESYPKKSIDSKGNIIYKDTPRINKVAKMDLVKDAHQLSSGTKMEGVYADHANNLKALANAARLEALNTPPLKYSRTAAKTYAPQVKTLTAKLNEAYKNKPLERKAQLVGTANARAKIQANPDLDKDHIKKIKGQSLVLARASVGARKQPVNITPIEWEAIQAGAISNNKLMNIIANADTDMVKQYAMPKSSPAMSPARIARARGLLARGATQAEVAELLGVSTTTLSKAINE